MKLDFNHLKDRNVTYLEHAKFALGICANLACSCVWFAVHGVLPCVQIPESFNLEAMAEYLRIKNEEGS